MCKFYGKMWLGEIKVGLGYGAIAKHFGAYVLYKLKDVAQKKFVEDLALHVTKGYMPISIMENH
jgi:hypothetical protein